MKKYLLKLYYLFLEIIEKIHIYYNKNYLSKKFKPIVLNTDETIDKLLSGEISMSRYGDGEFALMGGVNLKFQKYDKELANRLVEIIQSNNENHIVCIPNVFNTLDIYTEKAKKYWSNYLDRNLHKLDFIKFDKKYYDTQVTRLYIDTKDKTLVKDRYNRIKKLWKGKNILIIEGEKSRLGVGNDLFKEVKSLTRIICPAQSAFEKYNEILEAGKKYGKDRLILIALGPTATVLAYDLYKSGYRALDIGHIDIEYEWFLEGVSEKKPVKNKYIGEIAGGDIVEEMQNKKYKEEICLEIE